MTMNVFEMRLPTTGSRPATNVMTMSVLRKRKVDAERGQQHDEIDRR